MKLGAVHRPEVIRSFEQETGIRVQYSDYRTAADLDGALASGQHFDVILPSDFQLEHLIDTQQLAELDASALPNRTFVSSELLVRLTSRSRADRYAIPYMWGTVGLVVNEAEVIKALQKPAGNSWTLLFDPSKASKLKLCGSALGSVPEQAVSLLLNYKGKSVEHQNARTIQKAARELQTLGLPAWTSSFPQFITELSKGKICAATTWNGLASLANGKGNLRYSIPQEGGLLFIDSFAIPRNAPNPKAAYSFINYMLKPANAGRNAQATHFAPGLDLGQPSVRAALPEQVPLTSDEKMRLFMPEGMSEAQRKEIGKV
ncbi:extracellular solute-binding protein [Pseudomonas aeruginosa]|uniref:extracellular solute-binding protein n=1 Tax=Pseudomonas aeruginosa TaxID=287 RepID=UPI002A6A4273|nr:extracellular solute-binding protein [Pseudomonas aeruginosa]MDY1247777.1 extracellular solute-binding protein [Pseudomonas aeruginosa]HCF9805921.1 extracellular solute-binding protein [Pseudomonas aeruginosa]